MIDEDPANGCACCRDFLHVSLGRLPGGDLDQDVGV
jgi:hypothetical protein